MEAVFGAILPGFRARGDLGAFPRHVRAALLISVLLLSGFTILRFGRPFSSLSEPRRIELLEGLADHSWAPIRGVVTWWKLLTVLLAC